MGSALVVSASSWLLTYSCWEEALKAKLALSFSVRLTSSADPAVSRVSTTLPGNGQFENEGRGQSEECRILPACMSWTERGASNTTCMYVVERARSVKPYQQRQTLPACMSWTE